MRENKYISALLLIILVSLINILSSFVNWDIDLTADKKHSLSKRTHTIINDLDDRLFIKVYFEGDFPAEFKKLQKATEDLLRRLKSISDDNIDFEFINPNESDNDEEKSALFYQLTKLKLEPRNLDMSKRGKKVHQIIFPGALIYYKNKPPVAVNFLAPQNPKLTNARDINRSIENLEFEFVSAIQYLSKEKVDKIAFIHGNGELNERKVSDISGCQSCVDGSKGEFELKIQDDFPFNLSSYYNVDHLNIEEELTIDSMTPNLPKQLAMLNMYKAIVIAKPTKPFSLLNKLIIDQYIMQGGKVLWLVDGVNASMDSLRNESSSFIATKNNLNIDDQLSRYGVRINTNIIEDLRSSKITITTVDSYNDPQESLFNWPYFPLALSNSKHIISKGIDGIKCRFVSSIEIIKNDISKTILLHSSKKSRLNPAPTKISLGVLKHPPGTETYNRKYEPIAVLLEGEFESAFKDIPLHKDNQIQLKNKSFPTKMIVVSDGDLISTTFNNKQRAYNGNKHFLINAIQYLCDDISLSSLKRKELTLRLLDKEKIKDNRRLLQFINIIFPLGLLLIFFLYFTLNRKRKYA